MILFFLLSSLVLANPSDQLRAKLIQKFSVNAENIDPKIFDSKNLSLWLEVVEKIEHPRKIKQLKSLPFSHPELAKSLPDLYLKKISTPAALFIAQLSERPQDEAAVRDFQKKSNMLMKDASDFVSLFESACEGSAEFGVVRKEKSSFRITVVKIRGACLPVYYSDFSRARAVSFFDRKEQRLIVEGEPMRNPNGNPCQLDPPPPVKAADPNYLKHEVLLAVIDSGVDYNHVGLAGFLRFSKKTKDEIRSDLQLHLEDAGSERLKKSIQRFQEQPERLQGMGWDFLLNSNFPMDYFEMQTNSEGWMNLGAGHGSHVAGLALGNELKLSILPIRMIGNSKVRNLGKEIPKDAYTIAYDALALANLRGARIASISMEGFSERGQGFVDAIQDHPELIVVAAAGNGGIEISKFSIPLQSYLAPNLIRVAGLSGNLDMIHPESNYSSTYVDLAVASEDILSCTVGGESGRMTGTSMAAPRVANLAATLISINPNLGADEVKDILCRTADLTEKLKSKVRCGKMNEKRAIAFVLQEIMKSHLPEEK